MAQRAVCSLLGDNCVFSRLQLDIKALLTRVYGLDVEKVRTLNVEGKKKRTKFGFYRKPDWKKAYVTLRPPAA
jgi:large subunit ribosomal protein L23